MISNNPFAELSVFVPASIMQAYVLSMIALVLGGTLFDIFNKKSGKFFFLNWRRVRNEGKRPIGGGTILSLLAQSIALDSLISAEFCNFRRRISHLLTMYGFMAYVITTIIMVFGYPTLSQTTPSILPQVWSIGALMVCVGGYWFWFFIRADVVAEGKSPFRIMRADLFILSLLVSVTLGLLWGWLQLKGSAWAAVILVFYLIGTTVLFGSVPWSKFSHMFYKPAAALQRRVENANGLRKNLPRPANSPKIYGSYRQQPRHY